ncbi:Uncharacterized protein OBRU01_12725, partial [Operophtera brumata]
MFRVEPKFDLSQRGNLVIQIGEWRFNKHACWGTKVRWTCIKKKSGCNAAITTINDVILSVSDLNPVFAKSQRGNPVIMIGQYRFNRVNKYGSRTRWVCVKAKAGCRASLHTMDNAIVRVWGFHDPQAHTSACIEAMFTTTRAGNPLLMLGGYRFNRATLGAKNGALRWTCSSRALGCPAKVVTCEDQIISYFNHHRAVFSQTKLGTPVLIYGGHRFNRANLHCKAPKVRWLCTKRPSGCRVRVFTLDHEQPTFTTSRYGKPVIEYRGYRYNKQGCARGPRSRWAFEEIVFTTSRYGNPVIMIGKYRYNKWIGSKGPKARWTCTKGHRGCKSTITTLDDQILNEQQVVFSKSRFGKPVLMIGENRYNKWIGSKGPRARWSCVKANKKCKSVVITVNDEIVHEKQVVFSKSRFGKPVLMIGENRYNKWIGSKGPRARWSCVKAYKKCKSVVITVNDEIVH